MMITGPAIATAPDGGVWCSLLGANGCLVRVDPTTKERTLYEFSMDNVDWIKTQRIIHLGFHTVKNAWFAWRKSPDRPYKVCRARIDTRGAQKAVLTSSAPLPVTFSRIATLLAKFGVFQRIFFDTCNIMFVISSNLVDDDALNMLSIYSFWGTEWVEPLWYRCIPLPTQVITSLAKGSQTALK